MRSKTVLVIAVAFAFILGTMVTGAGDVFAKEKLTKLQKECKKDPKKDEKIKAHCELLDLINAIELGQEVPTSLGSGFIKKLARPCPSSDDERIQVDGGAVVLLSDGTVKVSSFAGGFTTPDPLFKSLPADVWHDIEVEEYSFSSEPEGCFGPSAFTSEEMLVACAVADNGDVYCVDGKVNNGVLSGTPWTFQGNTLP